MPAAQIYLTLTVVLLWGGLALRVLLELPSRNARRRRNAASLYLSSPAVAIALDLFASTETAELAQIAFALVGAGIWLGSRFKPELMLNAELAYEPDQITTTIRRQIQRRQITVMCAVLAMFAGLYVAVRVCGGIDQMTGGAFHFSDG